MSKQILLLEDDRTLGATVYDLLRSEGYGVDWVQDGEKAAERAYEKAYDLYLFDVNVPFLNGFELLEDLRHARDSTPTLFMSARTDMQSIAEGFRAGAFDYIKKPFFPEELLIRINAKIGALQPLLRYGEISFDPKTGTISKNGDVLSFGEVQLRLFKLFITRIGEVIETSELLECLDRPSSTALRVALNKLRQNSGFELSNIRGIGYRLEPR